jgi:subtilisin family serine protease
MNPTSNPFELANLVGLMAMSHGAPDIVIGLVDGPVAIDHPELASESIRLLPGTIPAACAGVASSACAHGTFIAGILCARRGSAAPAVCPRCTVLVRPVFAERHSGNEDALSAATPLLVATAIVDCVESGARIINLSGSLAPFSGKGETELEGALDYCARRHVIVVAAAGNDGSICSSVITRHPWVIPVVACGQGGQPLQESNLGRSIGARGVSAPGAGIVSLASQGETTTMSGTSMATAFVSGAIGLLWSEFPEASAVAVKMALTSHSARRAAIVPPVLNAGAAFERLKREQSTQRVA